MMSEWLEEIVERIAKQRGWIQDQETETEYTMPPYDQRYLNPVTVPRGEE